MVARDDLAKVWLAGVWASDTMGSNGFPDSLSSAIKVSWLAPQTSNVKRRLSVALGLGWGP